MLDYELAEIYGYTTTRFNEQVKNNIEKFDDDFMFQLTKCFGRSVVEEVTGLKSSGASKLISLLLNSNVIEPVSGKDKGKYRFHFEV